MDIAMKLTATDKQYLQSLRKRIQQNFGKKCPDYVYGCFTCYAWETLENLQDICELMDTKTVNPKYRKHFKKIKKGV